MLSALKCLRDAEDDGRDDLRLTIANHLYEVWFESYLTSVHRLNEPRDKSISELDYIANFYVATKEMKTALSMMTSWRNYSLKIRLKNF